MLGTILMLCAIKSIITCLHFSRNMWILKHFFVWKKSIASIVRVLVTEVNYRTWVAMAFLELLRSTSRCSRSMWLTGFDISLNILFHSILNFMFRFMIQILFVSFFLGNHFFLKRIQSFFVSILIILDLFLLLTIQITFIRIKFSIEIFFFFLLNWINLILFLFRQLFSLFFLPSIFFLLKLQFLSFFLFFLFLFPTLFVGLLFLLPSFLFFFLLSFPSKFFLSLFFLPG